MAKTPPRQSNSPSPDKPGGAGPAPTWMQTHGRDLKFLVIFGVLMGVYYGATTTRVIDKQFFPWYLKATTDAAGATLGVFYDDFKVRGNDMVGTGGESITVERGCDAIAPTALFVSAVIASPASIGSKVVAVLGGVTILMIVNLIRIISLFLTAVHWPAAFDVMHLDIWQAVFIILAIVLWGFWASWAARRRKKKLAGAT